jgi:hypothetical protein
MEQDVANPLITPRAVVEKHLVAEFIKDPQRNLPVKANIVVRSSGRNDKNFRKF